MNELITSKEQQILAYLYQTQNCTVGNLAKVTNINRTTLYPILGKLIKKGLVTSTIQNNITIYEALSPEFIYEWLKKKNQEHTEQTSQLKNWVKQISKTSPAPSLISKIKYFEGVDAVKTMYSDTWRDNKDKMIYAITDVKAAVNTLETFFYKEYMPARIARRVKVKDLMTENKEGYNEVKVSNKYLREAKLAKGLFENLNVEINIYSNKVAIVAFDKVKPCGLIIENEKISSAMKNIFEHIWKLNK